MAVAKWECLPEFIIAQIFSYLRPSDRLTAGRVCLSWASALNSPSIWRNMTFYFDRDVYVLNNELPQIAIKFGHHTKRLELIWSQPQIPYVFQRESGILYLNILEIKSVQLQELTLRDFGFCYKWLYRHKVNIALVQFLGCQRSLRSFRIINAYVRPNDVLRLVFVAAESCGNCLKNLDLRNAFKKLHSSHSSPRFLESLNRMSALTNLSIDYHALSDEVIQALSNASHNLSKLNIIVSASKNWHQPLTDNVWNILKNSCRNIQVFFKVENISHYEELASMLTPSIPLERFHLHSGSLWDHRRSRNFRSTVRLLINQYNNTLVDLHFHIKNNREMLDDLLLEVITRCKRLCTLQYDGVLRSMEIIRDICNLFRNNNITRFKTFHLSPREINQRNRATIREIMTNFKEYFIKQDLDFLVEEPTSTIVFY
ncbi:F-box only protein 39-like [Lycorma delicatula]|uniref:F-box only protein 39-like n=1 Tax=Lycorma delicatula TaxID=130591 RepID=UPI003F516AA9